MPATTADTKGPSYHCKTCGWDACPDCVKPIGSLRFRVSSFLARNVLRLPTASEGAGKGAGAAAADAGGAKEGGSAESKAAKHFLQGWCLIDNTQDEDWNQVQLTLVG